MSKGKPGEAIGYLKIKSDSELELAQQPPKLVKWPVREAIF